MCKKKDPNKKGFFGEFKEFITRGNVLDMAVGVIIGGAFTAIVTALTGGILQPVINYIIGLIAGNGSLEAARTVLGQPSYVRNADGSLMYDAQGQTTVDWSKTNYIDWGTFISAIINFLLVALILFLIIKTINTVHNKGVEAKKALEEKAGKKEEEKPEEK